jgi:hypothetical protein
MVPVKLYGYRTQVVAGMNYLFKVTMEETSFLVRAFIPIYCHPSEACVVFRMKQLKTDENNDALLSDFQDGTPL